MSEIEELENEIIVDFNSNDSFSKIKNQVEKPKPKRQSSKKIIVEQVEAVETVEAIEEDIKPKRKSKAKEPVELVEPVEDIEDIKPKPKAKRKSTKKDILIEDLKPVEEAPKPKHKTICEAFDYHNLKMEETLKVGKVCNKTWERYKITKNKVVAFMEKQYKVSDMELPAIRLRFVTEFEHYLLTTDKLQSNTAHKYIKNLKKIMNMLLKIFF